MGSSVRSSDRGLRKDQYGWQAFVKIDGRFRSKRFPADTSPITMQRWRNDQKALAVVRRAHPDLQIPESGSNEAHFEHDVAKYLKAVAAMPSIADRTLHLAQWNAVFRGRTRATITPLEIRTQLAHWREAYSPSSVNKRRTALMHLFTVLDGKSARNPVRDVPKYAEESETPRAQKLWTLYRLLACMGESKTRIRLRVLLWTGWPHAQIMRLEPSHLQLEKGRAFVRPRRKGKGRAGVWLPLLPGAIRALKLFHQWDCYGEFSQSSMRQRMLAGLAKLNAHRSTFKHPPLRMRPYDFRHSFGTYLAERIQDERALQELLLHSTAQQTRRYTESATAARIAAAVASLTPKVASIRKSARKKR